MIAMRIPTSRMGIQSKFFVSFSSLGMYYITNANLIAYWITTEFKYI